MEKTEEALQARLFALAACGLAFWRSKPQAAIVEI
jgi:hypothetical protein